MKETNDEKSSNPILKSDCDNNACIDKIKFESVIYIDNSTNMNLFDLKFDFLIN